MKSTFHRRMECTEINFTAKTSKTQGMFAPLQEATFNTLQIERLTLRNQFKL